MDVQKIVIPIRPLSVNAAWQGRRFKTKEYKNYEKEIALLIGRNKRPPIDGLLEVNYHLALKNWKVFDWDNTIKPLQDYLKELGYIKDDRHIMKATVEKEPSTFDAITVNIKPYEKTLATLVKGKKNE